MSLKPIAAFLCIFCSSAVYAHGQHDDVEDLPPPPKMEVTSEASGDSAQVNSEDKGEIKVEESKPQAAKPDPQ
jgi:hypothetical protein